MPQERMTLEEFRAGFPDLFGGTGTAAKPTRGRRKQKAKPSVTSLDQLLVPRSIGRLKLDPEQQLSANLYTALLAEWRTNRLQCVFTCVSSEVRQPVYNEQTAFEASAAQMKKLAMGCLPGFPDWIFLWAGGALAAELKTPGGSKVLKLVQRVGGAKLHPTKRQPGRLSDVQLVVQEWCRHLNVPHTVWTGVEQALDELRERGALAAR